MVAFAFILVKLGFPAAIRGYKVSYCTSRGDIEALGLHHHAFMSNCQSLYDHPAALHSASLTSVVLHSCFPRNGCPNRHLKHLHSALPAVVEDPC